MHSYRTMQFQWVNLLTAKGKSQNHRTTEVICIGKVHKIIQFQAPPATCRHAFHQTRWPLRAPSIWLQINPLGAAFSIWCWGGLKACGWQSFQGNFERNNILIHKKTLFLFFQQINHLRCVEVNTRSKILHKLVSKSHLYLCYTEDISKVENTIT